MPFRSTSESIRPSSGQHEVPKKVSLITKTKNIFDVMNSVTYSDIIYPYFHQHHLSALHDVQTNKDFPSVSNDDVHVVLVSDENVVSATNPGSTSTQTNEESYEPNEVLNFFFFLLMMNVPDLKLLKKSWLN